MTDVCSACGTPWCLSGRYVCADAYRSEPEQCPCDWGEGGRVDTSHRSTPFRAVAECTIHGRGSR